MDRYWSERGRRTISRKSTGFFYEGALGASVHVFSVEGSELTSLCFAARAETSGAVFTTRGSFTRRSCASGIRKGFVHGSPGQLHRHCLPGDPAFRPISSE